MINQVLARVVDVTEPSITILEPAREVEVPSSEAVVFAEVLSSSPTTREAVKLSGEQARGVYESSPPMAPI